MLRSVENLLCMLGVLVFGGCAGGDGGSSGATEPQLCQAYSASPACRSGEACGCVGMDPGCDCATCQAIGACHKAPAGSLLAGNCVAQSDDDCHRPSGACETFGACYAETQVTGLCLAGSATDCRSSRICTESGDCSLDGNGFCSPSTDADCADSLVCKGFGCCRALLGWCLGADDACVVDCPGASGCHSSDTVQGSETDSASTGDCSSDD